ncbi:MAG: glycosyltransferase [Candidatus Cryptobacteroides sp.]
MSRAAFIHNRFPAGGAEKVTIDIARYFQQDRDYEIFVYASHPDFELASNLSNCLTLKQIPTQSNQSKRSKAIERLIVEDKIDILVQIGKSLKDIEGIKRRTGCKVILACHGEVFWQRYAIMHRRQKKLLMWELFYRWIYADGQKALKMAKERSLQDYRKSDAYTVLCDKYKAQLEKEIGIPKSCSHVWAIENPQDKVENPQLEKEKILLFCGRFENWSKRVDRLLRIWGKVQDEMKDWRLILIGDGPDKSKLEHYAHLKNLERISFEGFQKDPHEYYRQASILCMTSQTEGWPLNICEAQAEGVIPIAFNCSAGVEETVAAEQGCGFLVEAFDEDKYATLLKEIASKNTEELLEIRLNAIRKRQDYTPDKIVPKWKNLFDKLIEG